MKTNFKSVLAVAMAAVIGMSSCVKENGPDTDGATTSVSLALVDGNSGTRAVGTPITTGATVDFSSGYVFFVNNVNVIVKRTEISSTTPTATEIAAGDKVALADLKIANTGGLINNVPGSAVKVFVAGNVPTGVTVPAVSATVDDIKGMVITAASQNNTAGSAADVTLYGDEATLITHPTVTDAKYAKVTLNAIGARIEIGKISYDTANTLVTGFQVDGIFINHYYASMPLNSTVADGGVLQNVVPADNPDANAKYTAGVAPYDGTNGILYDYAAAGIGNALTATSFSANSTTGVWAYNVLAPKTATTGTLTAPHIVVRLSNILPSAKYPGTQYLTVNNFVKAGTTTPVTTFQPGYIYRLAEIKFNESHLTDVPESKLLTVYVEVDLMTWSEENIDWNN